MPLIWRNLIDRIEHRGKHPGRVLSAKIGTLTGTMAHMVLPTSAGPMPPLFFGVSPLLNRGQILSISISYLYVLFSQLVHAEIWYVRGIDPVVAL